MAPITCPYCGSSYTAFQTNCDNCGATLPPPAELAAVVRAKAPAKAVFPPPPPRDVADNYAFRLLLQDGWAIAAMIFGFLGGLFSLIGAGLTAGIVTAFVGIPFLLFGLPFLLGGAYFGYQRYQVARRQVRVLQSGRAVEGRITELEPVQNVRVNGKMPWKLVYRFEAGGTEYEGSLTTLNSPGLALTPGNPYAVLYLEEDPEINGLWPRP